MAEEGRGSLTSKMNSNIYDNNAKEIDPQKVRTILAALIESQFNLVDDFLKELNYESGVTLEQYLNNQSISSSFGVVENVNIGETLKSYTTTGIIASAAGIQRNGQDFLMQ